MLKANWQKLIASPHEIKNEIVLESAIIYRKKLLFVVVLL